MVVAGAAYLGIGPGALPVLLIVLWGLVSGIMLAIRRTARASRIASIWYLPTSFFFLAFAFWNPRGRAWPTAKHMYSFVCGLALLSIFVMLVKPVFSVRPPNENASNREETQ